VACIRIKYGRGVCGTAAATRQVQVVEDVHNFPGHLACDAESNSEIVLPILSSDGEVTTAAHTLPIEANSKLSVHDHIHKFQEVIGVLDIDSEVTATFDEEDKEGLQRIVEAIADGCDW